MAKVQFVDKSFNRSSLTVIEQANAIIQEYLDKGFKLTLRQLYYQFVSRALIANKMQEYKRLGSIIGDARLAGLIDWDAIEDRGRNLKFLSAWHSPASILAACASQYRVDLWGPQPTRPEVWIEKEALAGVIEPVCNSLRVPFLACKGYMSLSELYEAAISRFVPHIESGKQIVIIHLGDHDPSGIDMSRDIADRLAVFGADVDLRRIALNMDQIKTYNPPPNPAKITDSRATKYIEQFGKESWELDALPPDVLAQLIQDEIESVQDVELWAEELGRELGEKATLKKLSNRWNDVTDFLKEEKHGEHNEN